MLAGDYRQWQALPACALSCPPDTRLPWTPLANLMNYAAIGCPPSAGPEQRHCSPWATQAV